MYGQFVNPIINVLGSLRMGLADVYLAPSQDSCTIEPWEAGLEWDQFFTSFRDNIGALHGRVHSFLCCKNFQKQYYHAFSLAVRHTLLLAVETRLLVRD